jgi:hypothetical protein
VDQKQRVLCMGTTDAGATGQPPGDPIYTPQVVPGSGTTFKASTVHCNEDYTIILTSTGSMMAMGSNTYGALGIGSFGNPRSQPTAVVLPNGVSIQQVSTGKMHVCAISTNNDLYCHGFNNFAQVPNLDNYNVYPTPIRIPGVKVKSVACGMWHTCIVNMDGEVWCSGASDYYQAGDPNHGLRSKLTLVLGGAGDDNSYETVFAGRSFSIALVDDNTGMFWGKNGGVAGDGSAIDVAKPMILAKGKEFQVIAAGAYMVCGIDMLNYLYCWGRNDRGTLGVGDANNHPIPTRVYFADAVTPPTSSGGDSSGPTPTPFPIVSPTRYPNSPPVVPPTSAAPTPSPIVGPGDSCETETCSGSLQCSTATNLCFDPVSCKQVCDSRGRKDCVLPVDDVPGCTCVKKKKQAPGCNVGGIASSKLNHLLKG